jgi:hypothetical protein
MRSLTFVGGSEGPRRDRTVSVAVTVLVHALIIAALFQLQAQKARDAQNWAEPSQRPPVEVIMPIGRLAPQPDQAPQAVAPVRLPDLPVVAGVPQVEVMMAPPRPEQDAIRLPQAETQKVAVAHSQAPSPAPAHVAPAAAPPALPLVLDSGDKLVSIERIGGSVALYTITGLTGLGPDGKPIVLRVDIGDYPDIEVALVNHVIAQIRARFPDEISWFSREHNAMMRLSMRPEDHDRLVKFLRIEIFGKKRSTSY